MDVIETVPSVAERFSRYVQDIQTQSDDLGGLAHISTAVAHLLSVVLMEDPTNSQTREALIDKRIVLFNLIKDGTSSEEDRAVVPFSKSGWGTAPTNKTILSLANICREKWSADG